MVIIGIIVAVILFGAARQIYKDKKRANPFAVENAPAARTAVLVIKNNFSKSLDKL